MTAAGRILSKVFGALNGSAVCAYIDDNGYTSSFVSVDKHNEYIWLVAQLIYRGTIQTGLTTRQILDDVVRAAYLLESAHPKIEQKGE